jgi:hypothetical protein
MAGIILLLLVLAVLALDLASWLKGADSRDCLDSEEWELRRLWRTMR